MSDNQETIDRKDFKGFFFKFNELQTLKKLVSGTLAITADDIAKAQRLGDNVNYKKLKSFESDLLGIEKELDRSYSFKLN